MPDNQTDALLICANAGKSSRQRRQGLRWLQKFRRESRSLAPALIYSFESRDSLAREFPLISKGMPGVDYFRLPSWCDVEDQLLSITPLTPYELSDFIRWNSGLQVEWRRVVHDLGNALDYWPEQRDRVHHLVTEWAASVRQFAADQVETFEHLERLVFLPTTHPAAALEIREEIDKLERGLCSSQAQSLDADLPPAPYARPPVGLSTIAIADDHGYEPDTIEQLRRLGYIIGGPAQNLTEARSLLQFWAPKVLLTDVNFPSRVQGLEIMHDALAANCFVIAVSRATVEPGDLPDGVEDCSGALNFQSAERIHRLIWKRALSRGITSHE